MIAIKNIYYMLSYAFQVLREQGYKSIATEEFDNTAELCAAILSRGISIQIKRGLGREYLLRNEGCSILRGKVEFVDSVRNDTMMKKQMICTYDEFSVNSYMNRIIKSTVLLLLHSDISRSRNYVKNKEAELKGKPHEVSGMLLYAKTEEEIVPNQEYHMSGNRISVKTLDLNQDFSVIERQLNGIVEEWV